MTARLSLTRSWSTRSLCLVVIALSLSLGLLSGCSSFRSKPPNNPDDLYDKAKKDLDSGDYSVAIKSYEQLEARFPFSNSTRQGQLI